MEVMQKERSSEKILNSIIQLLGSVDSNEMQYKLILNLYQERLRENGKYKSEGASIANGSTVVDICIPLPSFTPVSLSLSRSPLF